MKKGLKRIVVGVMSAAVIAGIVPVNALAVTNSNRETHNFEGRSVTVSLSIQNDRASASTSAASAETIETAVTLAYNYNGVTYYTTDYSSNYNAATATAISHESRAYSKYADSEHRANFYIEGKLKSFVYYWSIS